MKIDNSTGKRMDFYSVGQAKFDSIKIQSEAEKIKAKLEADIDLLWQVNSADIEALEDAKMTLNGIRTIEAGAYDEIIDSSLALINKALSMSHGDALERVANKARWLK
jgi:hypothetical protein